jgi:acetyl esterase/lipase
MIMPARRTVLTAAILAPALVSPFRESQRVAAQDTTPTVAHDAVETQRGVAYGVADGEELLLDVYLPPSREAPRPAVILLHGGGWSSGSRSDMVVAGKELARAGYVAFGIDYRLLDTVTPQNLWPTQLDDTQRAVRWVRAHAEDYDVDPERIAAYGWSSGGHLAAMLGVRDTRDNTDPALATYSSRVNCVVVLGGDMDLSVRQTDDSFAQTLVDFLGGTPEEQPQAYRDASPLTWVDEAAAPVLVVHGGHDDAILVEQSQRMVRVLNEAGVAAGYVALPGIGHSGIGTWDLTGSFALAFLGMQLHPER